MQTNNNSNGGTYAPVGGQGPPPQQPPEAPQSQQQQQQPPHMLTPTKKPPLVPRSRSVSPVPTSGAARPAPVSHQNRNVSWGGSSIGTNSPLAMHSPHTSNTPPMTLNDVLRSGAHEMEAETHILRAVEKITGQAHQKTNTETFELFGSIAEDEITKSKMNLYDSNGMDAKLARDRKTDAASGGHNRAPSEMSSNAESRAAKSRFQGLVMKVTEKQAIASKSGENNVEHELFGLTSAMNDMGNYSRSLQNKQYSMISGGFDTSLTGMDKMNGTIEEHVMNEEAKDSGRGPAEASVYSDTGTDISESGRGGDAPTKKNKKKRKLRKKRTGADKMVRDAKSGIKEDFELFQEFVGAKKRAAKAYARKVLLFITMPAIALACILFYFVEEPSQIERDEFGEVVPGQDATASWWLLLLGVRMVITLTMALITQALIIDYFALGSRFSLQWVGPIFTLLVVQSKGWPFVSIWWGAYNLILLSGDARYVRHWFYFQDFIGIFNEDNPGNNVVDNPTYIAVLWLMVGFGFACAIKRLVVGLLLGRQTFAHFGQELAVVMKSMVMIGEVGTLAREIEKDKDFYISQDRANNRARSLTDEWQPDAIQDFVSKEATHLLEEQQAQEKIGTETATATEAAAAFMKKQKKPTSPPPSPGPVPVAPGDNKAMPDGGTGLDEAPAEEFTASEQFAISELLDAWEEPKRAEESEERKITIGAIMQFRQALSFMKRKYPFLPAFGPADSRERCIESSQAVYDRLLLRTPHLEDLPFETLALLAKDGEGGINQEKARELIKLFRPERDGSLGKLEFVKSIDSVYKKLRLLSANVTNSSQIDKAIESLINFIFYFVLACIALSALGGDPMAVYLSFSSVLLGFSFMFGGSAAKYFEGVLFILVQRPYGVGDRIHLSVPNVETSPDGSSGWIVEKITLTTTTVYWGTTNERATLNNGAISNLRVINAARSPNATVYVELKFGIDTPYEKIAVFRSAVEQFLKDRPREWLTFVGFRPTEVAVDRGFLGYKIIAQHRNHWQGIGGILTSKADLTTYCVEVARQLDISYLQPPLPVDLSLKGNAASALQAIQPGAVGLDQAAIAAAMSANSPASRGMRGQHEAFGAD